MRRSFKYLLLLIGFTSSSLHATNYYVNNNSTAGDKWCTAVGNDGNSGLLKSAPKATVQSVFNTYDLNPADTVFVDVGTYVQATSITNVTDAGSYSSYVTILGAGRQATVFTAPAASHLFDITNVPHIEFRDLKMTSTQSAYYNVNMTGTSRNVKINNCVLTSTGTNIHYLNSSNKGKIYNSHITSTGGSSYCGILVEDCDSLYFYKDTVIANHYCIKLTDPNSQPNYNSIRECLLSVLSAASVDAAAVWFDHSDYDTVRQCKLSGGSNGIFENYDSDNIYFVNNFVYNSIHGATFADQYSESPTIRHNSFYTIGACIFMTMDDASTGFGALYVAARVQNNIFYSTANAAGDPMIYAAPSQAFPGGIDYNIYYGPNGARIGMFISTYYNTLANWQGVDHNFIASGKGDENSVNVNPNYTLPGSGQLELAGTKYTGNNYISSIPKDIYNTNRVQPVIGAWEDVALMPVELISFKGECMEDKILLEWSSLTETNCSYYIIERSSDAQSFTPIHKQEGAGTVTETRHYSFADNYENGNIVYYKLLQIDYDGRANEKGIITVNPCDYEGHIDVSIYPNPAGKSFTIEANAEKETVLKLIVSDLHGREILDQMIKVTPDGLRDKIILPKLTTGIYYITAMSGNRMVLSEKLVIDQKD